jgi:hypothetical protein
MLDVCGDACVHLGEEEAQYPFAVFPVEVI